MQNYINYYYNLNINDIFNKNNKYFFKIGNINYIFIKIDIELEKLQKMIDFSNQLLNNGIYTNKIVLNKDNNITTVINNNNYILISYYDYLNKKTTINDILYFSSLIYSTSEKIDWSKLWENKMDYFEYQISQFGLKNPIARVSFDYFLGYVELGIMLFHDLNLNNELTVISHKRIYNKQKLYYLYDPLNIIIDYKVRDISEYFKSKFFQKKNIFDEIITFLKESSYNANELKLFFIRMLYPSFYFDIFEDVMNGKKNDNELLKVINLKDNYEKLIINLYNYISKIIDIPRVEWLIY